jgi:hypothetical protein
VEHLFRDPQARAAQKSAMTEFAHALGADEEPPSLRAARTLLEFVGSR